jgi:hypothetical protein
MAKFEPLDIESTKILIHNLAHSERSEAPQLDAIYLFSCWLKFWWGLLM